MSFSRFYTKFQSVNWLSLAAQPTAMFLKSERIERKTPASIHLCHQDIVKD